MIRIENNTRLNRRLTYKAIGSIIDKYINDDKLETHYAGKKDTTYFEYGEYSYKLEVKYGKRDVTYIFSNSKEE